MAGEKVVEKAYSYFGKIEVTKFQGHFYCTTVVTLTTESCRKWLISKVPRTI